MVLISILRAKACGLLKCAVRAIIVLSGLGGLHSQAKKLFRSGLIVIGPD